MDVSFKPRHINFHVCSLILPLIIQSLIITTTLTFHRITRVYLQAFVDKRTLGFVFLLDPNMQ